MSSLPQFRDSLLRQGHPDKIVRLADQYLRRLEEMGKDFILPKEHAVVRPLLEYYAGDLAGWVKFIRGIRDALPPRSKQQQGIHTFYRTILIRLTQQERRVRLDSAVAAAVRKKIIPNDYDTKVRYARKCTQYWMRRRMALLEAHRRETGTGRLSLEEREGLLTEFWSNVDAEIQQGELPKP